ncbi:MAG: hypothetical protein KDD44_05050, partial [Bdellovibrionales bacterium]|nr:hypothetical protein [Bdellovibrionales bacterium]
LLVLALAERSQRPGRIYAALGVVTAFWANIHISVVLAPIFAVLVGTLSWIEGSRFFSPKRIVILGLVTSLSLLLNPYGYRSYLLLFDFSPTGQSIVADSVIELRGLFELLRPFPLWVDAIGALYCGWTIVTMIRLFRRERGQAILTSIAVVLVCLLLALSASRHASLLVMAIGYGLAVGGGRAPRATPASALIGIGVAVVSLSAGLADSLQGESWYRPPEAIHYYPVDAMEAASADLRSTPPAAGYWRILSLFGDGHFITWWLREHGLSRQARVYLDGRTDRLGKSRFLESQPLFRHAKSAEQLTTLPVDMVVAPRESKLAEVLRVSPQWTQRNGARYDVFVRVSPAPSEG